MAEGSMRLDVNISLRPKGETNLRPKVEIKNVNSFKSVQQAVDFETIRQAKAYDEGENVRQETRMWDEKGELWATHHIGGTATLCPSCATDGNLIMHIGALSELVTKLMRIKEGESDYRYFPEPDIPPMDLPSSIVAEWSKNMVELPAAKRER